MTLRRSTNMSEILKVKISPNAANNSIEGWQGDVLKVRIAAPPDKNKANEELISFLASQLHIAKSQITLLSGHTSRLKRLSLDGLPPDAFKNF